MIFVLRSQIIVKLMSINNTKFIINETNNKNIDSNCDVDFNSFEKYIYTIRISVV